MYVFCADFVWVSYWYMYGFRADFVWIPYRCTYEFRADFVWKSYSNLVWKVVAKSHTFPINFPHLHLVHFPYESRTPLFTGYSSVSSVKTVHSIKCQHTHVNLLASDSTGIVSIGACAHNISINFRNDNDNGKLQIA